MSADLSSSCILLVEDVPAMRMFIRIALEGAGARVLEAGSLEEARARLAEARPTSVLLDLELPDGNGLDLFDAIPNGVPVAALTADETEETAVRCHEAGCRNVIAKCKKVSDLGAQVAELEKARAPKQLKADVDPALLAQYADYLKHTAEEAKQSAAAGDLNSLRSIAHRLRGTALHFGFSSVDQCARAIGPAVQAGNNEVLQRAVSDLVESLVNPQQAG